MNKFVVLTFLFLNVIPLYLFQLPFKIFDKIVPRKIKLMVIKITKKAFSELILLLSIFAPYKLYISGDDILDESSLLICNHASFLDWFYLWNFISYFEDGSILNTILKHDLKNIPIIGSGMEFFEFIFLKRKLSLDKDTLINSLQKISKNDEKFWLLIFPEGAIISEETKKISEEYALKNNIPNMNHVLIPKTTGLNICAQNLLKDIGCIYDLTIGYKGIKENTIMWDMDIINSVFFDNTSRPEIHIHVNRIPIEKIYDKIFNPKDFTNYTYEIFRKKDKQLEFFKSKGYFDENNHLLYSNNIMKEVGCISLLSIWLFWIFISIMIYFTI